ncbi:MAG TPA: hypothetical protein VHZ26_02120 [Caulobacteraceae bacterium]|nr:hypothetical protein [Caulobacteraceae bacterium]
MPALLRDIPYLSCRSDRAAHYFVGRAGRTFAISCAPDKPLLSKVRKRFSIGALARPGRTAARSMVILRLGRKKRELGRPTISLRPKN